MSWSRRKFGEGLFLLDAPESRELPPSAPMSTSVRFVYFAVAAALIAWGAAMVKLARWAPDLYFYSYYSVDYSFGFIRRGLAGEIRGLLPGVDYFTSLELLRWVPTVVYALALGIAAWKVAVSFGRSERRLMMALLIPVLPFGLVFGLLSARPDLLGGAALALFCAFLASARSDHGVLTAAAVYGLAFVPLTLVHEATPFLYGLGAIVAVVVLGRHCTRRVQMVGSALALVPGALAGLAVAVFGVRGMSSQLCASVPHGQVDNPLADRPTIGEVLRGVENSSDYHDWFCGFILPFFDQGFGDATRFVASRGVLPLTLSVVFGVLVFAVTMRAISYLSGVPVTQFWHLLQQRSWWVLAGFSLLVPVFLTGVDWTRWWVIISFDLGFVFLIFAASQPQAAADANRRTRRAFVACTILLAIFPIGFVPGFAGVAPW